VAGFRGYLWPCTALCPVLSSANVTATAPTETVAKRIHSINIMCYCIFWVQANLFVSVFFTRCFSVSNSLSTVSACSHIDCTFVIKSTGILSGKHQSCNWGEFLYIRRWT